MMKRDISVRSFTLIAFLTSLPAFAQFTSGNLVVFVEGCGVHGGTCTSVPNGTGNGTLNSSTGGYGDNQASPITLFQYTPTATASVAYVNSLVLPQAGSGANLPVSGEYGSSSEGLLHLSGGNQYLTLMGYGIGAATFNAGYSSLTSSDPYGALPSGSLAQSGSLTGQSYTPVPRVATLIDANGNSNSSTALYNIFNTNNPRSIATANGATAYVSGQGSGCDATGGVFYTALGAPNTAPTAITGIDAGTNPPDCIPTIAQDTRDVQIVNNGGGDTLYVSVDSKEGHSNNRDFIGTLGTPPATSLYSSGAGPTQLTGFATSGAGKLTISSPVSNGNPLNSTSSTTRKINLSPVSYFFASPTILYVTDSGNPKNDSNGDDSTGSTNIGDGGLQKWIFSSGSWNLAYTLYQGLNLVQNNGTTGTTGLFGLAGKVVGSNALLYVTNSNLSDLDTTYLYGITDALATTTPPGASLAFTLLATAPADSNFKGVSFSPTIPAGSVEITSAPSGLAVTSANAGCGAGTYTTPITLAWTPSSSCNLSVVSPQNGPGGTQYAFSHWQDSNASTSDVVTAPSTTANYTATFDTQYQLTTAAGTGGTVSPGGFITSGTNASILATPANGYYFVNFTGAATSTSNPLSLPIDAPQSITANFAAQTTPTITWGAPAALTYGSALSGIQLNATASVPGTFVYIPAAGTVPPAGGGQTLSVAFTPTDTIHYTTAAGSTTITVNPAPLTPANLVLTKVMTRIGGNVVVQVTIANTGSTDATNVVLSSFKVGTATATPAPQSLGTISAGSSVVATISVPGSIGGSGTASTFSATGTYADGTFSAGGRITLP